MINGAVRSMRIKIFLIGLIVVLCQMQFVNAEIISIEAKGNYLFTVDFAESIPTAKEYALEKARQAAVEKAGVYVQSYSEVQNSTVLMDKVTVIAGSILEVLKDDYQYIPSADGKTVEVLCTINTRVDTSKINVDDIVNKEQLLETISEKNKVISEIMEQQPTDENQRLFMIAKYERDIDIFNLDSKIDWDKLMSTAQKLNAIDNQNSTAFRATAFYYRNNEDMQTVAEYCKKVLESSKTPLLSIEALSQLGDIYFNEFNDKATARKYIDQAIALTKKQYSQSEIDEFVNGTNIELINLRLTGKTNSIRELYILKSDLEDCIPDFEAEALIENLLMEDYKIYNIKYRTDW